MVDRLDSDVVIGGGGIAGSTAALALGRSGFHVMLVEPTLRDDKRFGGEILHPRGLSNLAMLGLDLPKLVAEGVSIDGFRVWEDGVGDARLAYAASGQGPGLAIEHSRLHAVLFTAACQCPNVTVVRGMKVTGVDDRAGRIDVALGGTGGQTTIRTRLLVGADGSRSQVRKLAGIASRSDPSSMVTMVTVPSTCLPNRLSAHLFVGSDRLSFAYAVDRTRARVLFNHVGSATPSRQAIIGRLAAACPDSIGTAMRSQLDERSVHRFLTSLVSVGEPCRGHTVLIGDASGTCHPLTASGMTAATSDALSLARAINETSGDFAAAAALHAARRRSQQLSRLVLATLLHEIYTDATPKSRALRRAMMNDWRSARGNAQGVSLLSMAEDQPRHLLRSMTRILYGSLGQLHRDGAATSLVDELLTGARASRTVWRYGAALLANSYRFLGRNSRVVA